MGHADRHQPLKAYCWGLLLSGERRFIQALAPRLYPDRVEAALQSLQHLVARAPWSDEGLLGGVRRQVLAANTRWWLGSLTTPGSRRRANNPGAERQYCGWLGKQKNREEAGRLSVATWPASTPGEPDPSLASVVGQSLTQSAGSNEQTAFAGGFSLTPQDPAKAMNPFFVIEPEPYTPQEAACAFRLPIMVGDENFGLPVKRHRTARADLPAPEAAGSVTALVRNRHRGVEQMLRVPRALLQARLSAGNDR